MVDTQQVVTHHTNRCLLDVGGRRETAESVYQRIVVRIRTILMPLLCNPMLSRELTLRLHYIN